MSNTMTTGYGSNGDRLGLMMAPMSVDTGERKQGRDRRQRHTIDLN